MFKRLAKKTAAKRSKDVPFGPWTEDETLEFVASVVGEKHEDTRNERFNLNAVAASLAGRQFDAAELWTELETFKLDKTNASTYNM